MSDKKILKENVINFYFKKKEYQSLSNFYECDITINNRTYQTGEHCFHGEKFICIADHCEDNDRKNKLLEHSKIFLKPASFITGAQAKSKGGKKGFLLNEKELELWTNYSIEIQKQICKYKLENYEIVSQDLLNSGNKILIHPAFRVNEEKVKKANWEGKGIVKDNKVNVLGQNMLGKLWMELRNKITIT